MVQPSETYNEAMLDHLRSFVIQQDSQINAVHRIAQHGDDLSIAAKARIISEAKTPGAHLAPCVVCDNWLGNPKPPEPEPEPEPAP